MNFLELVKARRSCRAFTSQAVADDDLKTILEAARLAPSACNLQPLRLYVLQGQPLEAARACAWLYNAPAVVLVCTLDDKAWQRKYDQENFALADAAIAIDHMALCAASLGLSSCIIGAIKTDKLTEALQLPAELHPQLMLALGHADPAVPDTLNLHDKRVSAQELIVQPGK